MRYLVSGAAGFIGSQLSEGLVERGDHVLGVDCFTPNYRRETKESNLRRLRQHHWFELAEADLRSDDLSGLVDEVDVVFHLSGQSGGVRKSWGTDFSECVGHNVLSTQRLLAAAAHSGVRRFIYASSSSVYGNAVTYPTTEAMLPQPFSPLGVAKLAAEHLCGAYAANWGLHTVALRYFTVAPAHHLHPHESQMPLAGIVVEQRDGQER
jgi:nucleoside-diphosphate-sugar epimerase